MLAVKSTAANAQERSQVRSLAQDVPHGTKDTVTLAWVDQGKTGQDAKPAARNDEMLCSASGGKTRQAVLSCWRAVGRLRAGPA